MISRTATIALFTSTISAAETLIFDEEFKTFNLTTW